MKFKSNDDRSSGYKQLFSTATGQLVFNDLKEKFIGNGDIYYPGISEMELAARAAQMDVINYIQKEIDRQIGG